MEPVKEVCVVTNKLRYEKRVLWRRDLWVVVRVELHWIEITVPNNCFCCSCHLFSVEELKGIYVVGSDVTFWEVELDRVYSYLWVEDAQNLINPWSVDLCVRDCEGVRDEAHVLPHLCCFPMVEAIDHEYKPWELEVVGGSDYEAVGVKGWDTYHCSGWYISRNFRAVYRIWWAEPYTDLLKLLPWMRI